MKTTRVATLNARTSITSSNANYYNVLFILCLCITISCSNNDDFQPTNTTKPPVTVSTGEYEVPIDSEFDIIYTDLSPDYENREFDQGYDLDLNNDQLIDFTIISYSGFWEESLEINSKARDHAVITFSGEWDYFAYAIPLEVDMVIFNLYGYPHDEKYEKLGFISVGDCTRGASDCFYDWKDKNDKFLGLRFKINGNIHFGWLRMDVQSRSQWVIKDYTYNAIPNMPILAGQIE